MLDDKNIDIAAKLQALRADYAARLPVELAALIQLADLALEPEQRAGAQEGLRQRLHKLAGSAGSFGYPELGQQARQLEHQLNAWQESGPEDEGQVRDFALAIKSLTGYLDTEGAPWPPPLAPSHGRDQG